MERLFILTCLFQRVHFIKLLSCSLYNSWDTLKNEGSAGLQDTKLNPSGAISKLAAGHYDLGILSKKITDLFSNFKYHGLETETNTPFGQLVISNFGAKKKSALIMIWLNYLELSKICRW